METWHEDGRVFVVGDVHGCYDMLMEQLDAAGFDPAAGDHLYSLGDLVDRGPDSRRVLELLDEPWFDAVMGNHEHMMIEAWQGDPEAGRLHVRNGGQWFGDETDDQRRRLAMLALHLPIARTVHSPSGRSYGLVHADLWGLDWRRFIRDLEGGGREAKAIRNFAMWSRDTFGAMTRGDSILPVAGVDTVMMGHNALKTPVSRANLVWMDTGAGFRGGKLTIVELD